MSVENLRSVMHIDPLKDVLYSIPDSDNHGDLLIRPQGGRMVNELGDIVCESLKEDEFPDQVGALHKVKDVTYGITRITYYRKECME